MKTYFDCMLAFRTHFYVYEAIHIAYLVCICTVTAIHFCNAFSALNPCMCVCSWEWVLHIH